MSATIGSLPPGDRHPHGTRARYVAAKCRCDASRAANTAAYHARKRRGIEAATERAPAPAGPIERGGRTHKISCPGIDGPCVAGSFLRKDSKGGLCARCRDRLSFNGLVDAAPVRKHIRALSRKGVGYKAVADAASIGRTVVMQIRAGVQTQTRAATARAILAITPAACADSAHIPAGPTWRLIGQLIEKGWTRRDIAFALGRQVGALQIRKDKVRASTALAVERLFRTAGDPPQHGTRWQPLRCDCIAPSTKRGRCSKCHRLARPDGVTGAMLAGSSGNAKPVHRAFGFDGGWQFDQRRSKKAAQREELELRQLAKGRASRTERAA